MGYVLPPGKLKTSIILKYHILHSKMSGKILHKSKIRNLRPPQLCMNPPNVNVNDFPLHNISESVKYLPRYCWQMSIFIFIVSTGLLISPGNTHSVLRLRTNNPDESVWGLSVQNICWVFIFTFRWLDRSRQRFVLRINSIGLVGKNQG